MRFTSFSVYDSDLGSGTKFVTLQGECTASDKEDLIGFLVGLLGDTPPPKQSKPKAPAVEEEAPAPKAEVTEEVEEAPKPRGRGRPRKAEEPTPEPKEAEEFAPEPEEVEEFAPKPKEAEEAPKRGRPRRTEEPAPEPEEAEAPQLDLLGGRRRRVVEDAPKLAIKDADLVKAASEAAAAIGPDEVLSILGEFGVGQVTHLETDDLRQEFIDLLKDAMAE